MTTSPIDYAHLRQFSLGDPKLEGELLGLLRAQVEQLLPQLDPAAEADAWAAAAHTLKGASRGVGAFALGDACEAAESATNSLVAARSQALIVVQAAAAAVLAHVDATRAGQQGEAEVARGEFMERDVPQRRQGAARP